MNRLEDLIVMKKLQDLMGKKEEKKEISPICWVIAVVLVIAAAGAIAYALYRYFTPDYLEDFEDDFEDDFDDDFFEEEEDDAEEKEETSGEEKTEA